MAFPAGLSNGQTATINGVVYVYSATDNAWTRVSTPFGNLAINGNLSANIATFTGNLYANANAIVGNLYLSSLSWSNGNPVSFSTYSNSNVTAYLTDGTINITNLAVGDSLIQQDVLDLNNNNLYNVNTIRINDPGTSEGISWEGGSGWNIYESPNDLSNNTGNLQIVLSGARALTVDTNQTVNIPSTWAATSTSTGALTVGGGVGIGGNLWVGGNIYAARLIGVDTSTISVSDPLLYLTATNPSPYNYDIGFFSHFVGGSLNNYQHTGFSRNYTDNTWTLFSNVFTEPGITLSWTEANIIYDPIKVGSANIANTTVSTSTTTGALVVGGGAGIAGALYIANTGDVSANIGTVKNNLATLDANVGAFETYANTKIGNNSNGNLVVVATTTSTDTTTGALVVQGGAGIAGNAYIGGNIVVTSNISANKFFTTQGLYWAGNGTAFSSGTGLTYTADTAPPVSGNVVGDQWYNTVTDVLFEYLDNGVSQYWVDVQTSVIAANAVVTIPELIQANLGAFQSYANAKIGTNTDGNIVVSSGAASNYYNSAGAGSGIDIVSTTASKVGYLNIVGGTSSSGLLTFGNISSVQAVITTGTDNSITFATKSPTTGANAASAALTINSNQNAQFFSNLTVTGNVSIGANITSNVTFSQSGLFRGPYNEASTLSGVFVGNTGTGVPSPRVGFFNGNTQQNWQIDNFGGAFRWFVPGAAKMILYDSGNLNVSGGYTVGGKKAVNGPAFRAYITTGQTISSTGSQIKVTFGGETFDTDGCFASSTFTPTVEGYYQLNATVRISGPAGTGENMLILYKNGTEYARGTNGSGTEIGASFYSMQVSDIAYANGTTDTFEIYIQQGSGSNKDTTAGQNISYFSGCMIRGA
jgi:hypothetical protein